MTHQFTTVKNPLTRTLLPLDAQVAATTDPLPKQRGKNHIIWGLIGKKGSGKSTLLLNALDKHYDRHFDRIYLISTTARRDPKMSELVNSLDEKGQFFDELTPDLIDTLLAELAEYNDKTADDAKRRNRKAPAPKINNLIIFDDCIHALPRATKGGINRLFTSNRHFKASVWVCTQKYNLLNTTVRQNADMWSFFRCDNGREKATIQQDLNIDPALFEAVYDFVFDAPDSTPNEFLHVSLCSGGKPIFFKKLDRIV